MKKIILSILSVLVLASTATAQKLDRSVRPKPGPAPEVKMGDAEHFVSSNGIKVYVVENHKLPRVSYSIDFDVKPALEKDKVGAASMVGDMLEAGSKKMPKDEFNKAVDMIGGTVSIGSEGMYMQSLTKNTDKLLALASDVLLNPAFPAEEMDKLKKQMLSGLATEKDDPQAMSRNLGAVLNFGKNHYRGEVMTEETVENITLADVKRYYETYLRPNVAYMAIVGDITKEEAKRQVEKYFGDWKKRPVPVANYETPPAIDGPRVGIVNKSGAVQSVVKVTYPIDIKPNNPDLIPLRVANGVLGGGSTGRLFQYLREKKAWTYGSYSGVRANKWDNSGSFTASANATAEATDSSVGAIINEMENMRRKKVTQEELEGYKNYMAGTFALGLENPRTLARYAINIAKNDLPKNYYKNYLKNIEKVTADDVMRVSKKYIRPGKAHITVAGDKKSNMEKLKKFGPVTVYDVYGNEVDDSPAATVPTGMTAKKIIEDYLDKTGGMNRWKSVKDVQMTAELTGAAPFPIQMVSKKKAPYKYYSEMKANVQGNEMVVGKTIFNGTGGTSMQMGMAGPTTEKIEGDAVAETKTQAVICDELAYLGNDYRIKLMGTEKVEGEDCYAVAVTDPSGEAFTEYYSMNTGLKLQSVSTMDAQNGKVTVTAKLSDYKTVGGLKFPYKIVRSVGPQSMNLEVKTVEVNKGIDDSVFEAE